MHAHTDGDDRLLHLFIVYGITGVRDMAGDVAKLADARRRINSGELIAPRSYSQARCSKARRRNQMKRPGSSTRPKKLGTVWNDWRSCTPRLCLPAQV
jgi:hypothetical protein